jgi:hypothetical protein
MKIAKRRLLPSEWRERMAFRALRKLVLGLKLARR